MLAPAFIDFAQEFPEIALDVHFSDRAVNIVDEGFDVALRIGRLSDSNLIARRLSDIRIVIAASEAYLTQHGTPGDVQKLTQHQCIIDTNFRDPLNWQFRTCKGASHTVSVQGRLRFSNAEACLAAAIAGWALHGFPPLSPGRNFAPERLFPYCATAKRRRWACTPFTRPRGIWPIKCAH